MLNSEALFSSLFLLPLKEAVDKNLINLNGPGLRYMINYR